MNMMKLKIQTLALRRYQVLASIIFLAVFTFSSCKKVKKETSSNFIENFIKSNKDKKLIKQIDFEYGGKKLKSLFFLKEKGELGTNGFVKELEVFIFENKNLLDKFLFQNGSVLCDLKILTDKVNILTENNNQFLFFPIIHSCDGEEPELLIVNIWNGEKRQYEIEIPVYFESDESKANFIQSLHAVSFKSNKVKKSVYDLVERMTKIDLSKVKVDSKIDKNNPKCFTDSDISKVNNFLSAPSNKVFFKFFDKKEDVDLEFIIGYLKSKDCLDKKISVNKINNCTNELKSEVYCSYNITQEEEEDGELSEETLYLYFKKNNGIIYLNKLESEGR